MRTELAATVASLDSSVGEETRRDRAVGLAKDLSVIWILPCVLLCGACGYFLLLYWAFLSYALSDEGSVPARLVLLCVAAPLLLLVVMVVLGRLASRAVAGWLSLRPSLERVPVGVLAVVAMFAATGAAAAVPAALLLTLGEW